MLTARIELSIAVYLDRYHAMCPASLSTAHGHIPPLASRHRLVQNGAMPDQRWKAAVPKEKVKFLAAARRELRNTWNWDRKDRKSYPLNTSLALSEIEGSVRSIPRRSRPMKRVQYFGPKKPKRIGDLIPEQAIKNVFEDQHSETYAAALADARKGGENGFKAVRSIFRAAEQAYVALFFGLELLPKPKVNILHRGIIKIGNALGLKDLSHPAMAEFLDYLCPCGRGHNWDAVRKLRKRVLWKGAKQ